MKRLIVILFISGLLVSGCSSGLRIGYIGSNQNHKMSARYVTYHSSNSKNISLSTGDSVEISYDIELKKGTISLSLMSPTGTILWEESVDEQAKDKVSITAIQSGDHRLLLQATQAGGRHEVSWTVSK